MDHTPGPWKLHRLWSDDVVDSTGSLIVSAYGDYESPETQANARLISAAPELLAALEALLDITHFSTNSHEEAIHNDAMAAILKAKGKM
jgi:hypothetical protein